MASGNVYRVIVKKKCDKQINKAPQKIRGAVALALKEIAVDPYHNPNVKKLSGKREGQYRYRIGGYRLIYEVHEQEIIVIAVDFGPRGDVYN